MTRTLGVLYLAIAVFVYALNDDFYNRRPMPPPSQRARVWLALVWPWSIVNAFRRRGKGR